MSKNCNPIRSQQAPSSAIPTSAVNPYDGVTLSCIAGITVGSSTLNEVIAAIDDAICALNTPLSSEVLYDGSLTLGACSIAVTTPNPTVNTVIADLAEKICDVESTITTAIGVLDVTDVTITSALIAPSACFGTFTGTEDLETYLAALATYVCAIPPASPSTIVDLYDYESISRGERTWVGIGGDSTHTGSSLEPDITAVGGTSRYYINGRKVSVADNSVTLAATSDNYVDVNLDGDYNVTSVAVAGAEPPLPANEIRIAKYETDGSGVVAYTDRRVTQYQDGERWFDDSVLTRHILDLNVTGDKLEDFGTAGTNDWSLASFTTDAKGRVSSYVNNTVITSLADNDILKYNNSLGKWENVPFSSALIPTGTIDGETLYYDTGSGSYLPSVFLRNMDTAVGINASGIPQTGLQIGTSVVQAWELDRNIIPTAGATTGGSMGAGTFYYTVTALDDSGNETIFNAEDSATTDGITLTAVDVSWNEVPLATSYRVYKGSATLTYTEYFDVPSGLTYTDTGAAGTAGTPPTANQNAYSVSIGSSGIGIGSDILTSAVIAIRERSGLVQHGIDLAISGNKSAETVGIKSIIDSTNTSDNVGGWFSVENGANNYVLRLEDGVDNTGKILSVLDAAGNIGFALSTAVSELDDLTDVSASAPNDWDTLAYDSGAGMWVTSGSLSNDLDNVAIGNKPGTIDARLHINSTNGSDLLKIEDSVAGVVATIDTSGVFTYNEEFVYKYTNGGASPLGVGKILTSDGFGGATWETNTAGALTLQQVTDNGNNTTNDIELLASDLLFTLAGNTTTLSANPTTDRLINLPDLDGTVTLGTGTANSVTRWINANTVGDSSFNDDGTNTGFGVTANTDSRIDLLSSNTNSINIVHTGTATGQTLIKGDYTGTGADMRMLELEVSGANATGNYYGAYINTTSSSADYATGIFTNVNNASIRNIGANFIANSSGTSLAIGAWIGASQQSLSYTGTFTDIGVLSSAYSDTGDAVTFMANSSGSVAGDLYGMYIDINNGGPGTAYIGRFRDRRTEGAGKFLTSIDSIGTAEWATLTLASLTDPYVLSHVTTSTASYNTGTEHTIFADTSSNDVTINLPAAASNSGRVFVIKKTDAANKVVLDGNASETIDGVTTQEYFDLHDWVKVQSNGTNWFIIA